MDHYRPWNGIGQSNDSGLQDSAGQIFAAAAKIRIPRKGLGLLRYRLTTAKAYAGSHSRSIWTKITVTASLYYAA